MSESVRNIVITGMMGTGKSTVGQIVARKLNRPFLDTDQAIEKRVGKSISAIFDEQGESAFRKAEWELCQELSAKDGLVIATGGGFLVPSRCQEMMHGHSVFCLNGNAHTIAERTKGGASRPLLSNTAAIQQILEERRAAYQRIFHHVDTDNRSVDDVASNIIERFILDDVFKTDSIRVVRISQQSPCPIVVKDGAAFKIPQRLRWAGVSQQRVIIVTQEKLKTLYGQKMEHSFSEQGMNCEWLSIPDGERHKNLATVEALYKNLLHVNAKRDDIIIAFGGGVVGDVAGLASATYMRGLQLVQVPTTLLAMVDSSIGGKTGVDLDEGKNLVGAFKQPLMVLTDASVLNSLSQEEMSSGMAEVIKHALIGDPELFDELAMGSHVGNAELVFRALKVKADIVEEDPFETGRRAVLNLGHTFGHALEKVSNYELRHGYAVAIGMVAACELGHRLSLCDASMRTRLEKILTRFDLPIWFSGMNANQIINAMKHDKKSNSQGLQFIVPHDVGDVRPVTIDSLTLWRKVSESLNSP